MDWILGSFVLVCVSVAAFLIAKPLVDAWYNANSDNDEENLD